jgi:hypothetical protein
MLQTFASRRFTCWLMRTSSFAALLIAGCMSTTATAQPPQRTTQPSEAKPAEQPADAGADLDPAIPTPKAIIGHDVAERPARYDALVRYMQALDAATDLVALTPYATSHEGRTLYYVTISSAANIARLDQIKADNARIVDQRGGDTGGVVNITERLPAIAWLAYCIHGDEISPTDSALEVMYRLAAGTDDATKRLREELIIHIDPLQNPDGRERYLANLQTFWGKVPNDDYQSMQHNALWAAGRTNHYLFDLNRDWLPLVHPETQGRVKALSEWNPHFQVDSHEMGSLDTYLFDPPREPINPHYSQNNLKWRKKFAQDQAGAFNQRGWSYYTREWLDDWYPGYTNAWANLTGAISVLYEQAGAAGASVMQPHGKAHTYKMAVEQNVVSTLANLETLRANRQQIIHDFMTDAAANIGPEAAKAGAFIMPPSADEARRARFIDVLQQHRIEFTQAAESFTAQNITGIFGETVEAREFPADTLIVRANQPRHRLIKTILGFDPRMTDAFLAEERHDLEQDKGTRSYDITAWNLPMAYGLESYWAKEVSAKEVAALTFGRIAPEETPPAAFAWLIDIADANALRAAAQLLHADCKVRAAIEPFTLNGRRFERGTLLIRRLENGDDIAQQIHDAMIGLPVDLIVAQTALVEDGPDLGGQKFPLLQRPRIAIASQWPVNPNSFGSTWLMIDERLRLPCSPINIQEIGGLDLRRYNVLILPDGGDYGAVLNDDRLKSLKAWIEGGGTLIAMSNAAAFLANEKRGLSAVRLRPDVLDQLKVYGEAVQRERASREITVDASAVWSGTSTAFPATQAATAPESEAREEASELEGDELKRWDEWASRFMPQGAFVRCELDPDQFLAYGLGERLPVMFAGSACFMSKRPVQTAARMSSADTLRLSGLLWPEARLRIADTAYATRESLGNGQVILFAGDPFFRGFMEGTGRMLQNAIILGTGLGASAPVPWE